MTPISDASFDQLIKTMEKFIILSVKFKLMLRPMLFETTCYPEHRILNIREKQKIVWFSLDGLIREIREDVETLEEKTVWFWDKHCFLYTNPGFFSQEVSPGTIQVLETTRVILISYENWSNLKNTLSETETITEMIRGSNVALRQSHDDDIKYLSTDDRYLKHEELIQNLVKRTKVKYIAEFLGMSADTLGRLRKKHQFYTL